MKAPQVKNKIIVIAVAIVLLLVIVGGIIFAMISGNGKKNDEAATQKAAVASQEELDSSMKDVRNLVEISKQKHEAAKSSVSDSEKRIKVER